MWEMPVSMAGEILGEMDQKLWRALFAHGDAAWAEVSRGHVVWVSADEMNRKKGHNYSTVFVHLGAKRGLLVVEGKDASTCQQFAEEFSRHNGHPKAIMQVAVDMSPAQLRGVTENSGDAVIMYDTFHVVGQVSTAVERRGTARCGGTQAPGEDLLAVAQEPGALDGAGGAALGAVEGQAAGDGPGVCHTAGVAAGVCVGRRAWRGAVCEMVLLGADGSRSVG